MVMAGGAGTGMSSGAAGGIGSLSSQLGANLGFSTQVGAINRETSAFEQSAMRWQGIGALASGVGQAAGAYRDYKWNKAGGTVNNGLSGPGE